jgi:LmbE family N-acetylglucosaminyl deacetylase
MSTERADFLVVAAHLDDVEVQMGGTVAKLVRQGFAGAFLDLCEGNRPNLIRPAHGGARPRRRRPFWASGGSGCGCRIASSRTTLPRAWP